MMFTWKEDGLIDIWKQLAPALAAIAGAIFTYIKWSHSAFKQDVETYRKLWSEAVKSVDELNEKNLALKEKVTLLKEENIELKSTNKKLKNKISEFEKEIEDQKNE